MRLESYAIQPLSTAFTPPIERAYSMTASSSMLGAASSAPTAFLSPDTPVHFGIVGCGWFGRVHVERLSEISNVCVAAVCDPEPGAAQKLALQVPAHLRPEAGVAVYTDVDALLAHPGLHAVSINSPNRWHVPQILAALQQGLHVLCEKPLTLVPDEVTQVVTATQAADRVVAVAYQSRYRRDARLLRLALQSGKWGRVTSVSVFACEDWVTPNVGTWRHDPARCLGGYFGDANGHQLDALFWMTQLEPMQVRATMEKRGTLVPIVTWGEARLRAQNTEQIASGIPMTFMFVGDARQWREEIAIQTEGADWVMRDTRLWWTDGIAELTPFTEADLGLVEALTTDTPDAAFAAALRGGEPVASAPETVGPVLHFTLAALESTGSSSQTVMI